MRLVRLLTLGVALLAGATPAFADATVFLGTASAPTNRTTRGFALGAGLLIVGFEFEYGDTVEDPEEGAPSRRTGMGNVYVQTPVAIYGLQPYLTTGGGVYRESLGTLSETNSASTAAVAKSASGSVRPDRLPRVLPRGSPVQTVIAHVGLNLGSNEGLLGAARSSGTALGGRCRWLHGCAGRLPPLATESV
jgi:hypothetical protein